MLLIWVSNKEVEGFGLVKHICVLFSREAKDYKIIPGQSLLCILEPAESSPYENKSD